MSSRAYPELERVPRRTRPRDLPAPPAELAPDTFAGRLYDMLEPLAEQDPQAGWSLLILCNAIGTAYQLVEDWVRDTPDGPGWSLMLDVDRCPSEALPWLGQFAGVRIPVGVVDDAQRRAWIKSTDGFSRGTRDAMVAAALATLTGNKRLVFRERDGASQGYAGAPEYAYVLTVYSYTAETPNPTATLNALLAQKPGGIRMFYSAVTRQDYQNVKNTNATYTVVVSSFSDYDALALNQPG
jgi:hypothetical protein